TLLIAENGVAEVIMTNHERAGIPSAVLVHRDEGPPDHMLVVVYHQVFLEVDRAAFGQVKLIERDGTFHRPALDYASHIPQLRDIECAPLHAWQIPLQPGEQAAFELEQPIFLPGDRKSTRLNSSHVKISYAVFCLKKKT